MRSFEVYSAFSIVSNGNSIENASEMKIIDPMNCSEISFHLSR